MKDLLILSIIAKPGTRFASYDLFQALFAAGLTFGDLNIFHYHHNSTTLFSLVSAEEPGEFDLNNIGNFSCSGLMLFMHPKQVPDPQYAFNTMLEVAERLAEDLDGELRADPRTPWDEKIAQHYQQVLSFA